MSTEQPEHSHRRRKRKRYAKRRTRWWLTGAVAVWSVVLGLALITRVMQGLEQPLGDPLPTYDPAIFVIRESETTDEVIIAPPVAETAVPVAMESIIDPICDGPPEMELLIVGSDARVTSDVLGLADIIRVVRFNFVMPSISVITLPRALWVAIPGLPQDAKDNLKGYLGTILDEDGNPVATTDTYGLLNTAFFYGNLYETPGRGPGLLSQTLYANFGLSVDHYLVVDMMTVEHAIDTVGGVSIYIPYDVAEFQSGQYVFTGAEAILYARTRQTDSDWYRTERQGIIMQALWEQMVRPANFARVPDLVDRFFDEVRTDLSRKDFLSIACLMNRVSLAEAESLYISTDMAQTATTSQGFFILQPDYEQVQMVLTDYATD